MVTEKEFNKINKFITLLRNSHTVMTDIFMDGSCYNLYLMLRNFYPDAIAWNDEDHIVTEIEGRFFDITGEVSQPLRSNILESCYPGNVLEFQIDEMLRNENKNVKKIV